MRSLSSRLLLLTAAFVMLAEVAVFAPSVARFRLNWFEDKLRAAHLAILALDATPDGMVSEMLRTELLRHVGAYAIFVRRGGARLMLADDMPPPVAASFNLADDNPLHLIRGAFATLARTEDRVIRIMGPSPQDPAVTIELVLDEAPLRMAMTSFAWRIFWLSLAISLIAATLVYLTLQWLMVRPMRRITESMIAFRENPEDAGRVMPATGRRDEIGTAQRELAGMQARLRDDLTRKAHLAALGGAVAKINHDLRGILSSALLVSDRLESSDDPEVRRAAPTLVAAIERATALCSRTLDYVGQAQPQLRRSRFPLHDLVEDVGAGIAAPGDGAPRVENRITDGLEVAGDRDQLFRVLNNLVRNAADAGAHTIAVSARPAYDRVEIYVSDDGPGLPQTARENLFKAFAGSARAGGSGLGLAIAQELVHGHGGELSLVRTGGDGTLFRLDLPAG